MSTYILTYNPAKWDWGADRRSMERRTAAGRTVRGRWSLGIRKTATPGDDRVYLLRQGPEPRGIIAAGTVDSDPFTEEHWDEDRPGQVTTYVHILWDRVLSDGDLLPLKVVSAKVTGLNWDNIPGGGVELRAPGDAQLDRLWSKHIGGTPGVGTGQGPTTPPKRKRGQVWQQDPVKRKAVEDHGQALLEQHYRDQGWKVTDTRQGNPYDAKATKGKQTRYLEAKGTETDGVTVQVTKGEVDFARKHPGECILGVIANIRFLDDGTLDKSSGTLTIHPWDPDTGVLTPRSYDWQPPTT